MKKILCLDGGGIRGVLQAVILLEIERRTGKRIADLFEMVAGTSIGGIIALGLVKPDPMSGPDLVDLFVKRGHEIFDRSCWDNIQSMGGLNDEKYPSENIEGILREYFGHADLKSAKIPALVTAYETVTREPFFFKSWEAERFPEKNFPMWKVARSTSAAPTYFEPYHLRHGSRDYCLVDGGLFANNPTMCAFSDALRLWGKEPVCVVSIGTGDFRKPLPYDQIRDWGAVSWIKPLIDIMMGGVSRSTAYQARQILNSSGPNNRYFRFQIALPEENRGMDDASEENIQDIIALADVLLETQANQFGLMLDSIN